ncbi:MAG TPA: GDSL-type esterase/lipase family protein [Chitinophagaceae bacterium]|nr:GDSL-type esterase/lipase family protein [Chitinophagaceae bacterium]
MQQKFTNLAIIICLFYASCSPSKKNVSVSTDELPATNLQPFGRYIIDNQKNLELISSAVHFGFSFEGKDCEVFASLQDANSHNYFQYTLDGTYQKKIRVEGNSNQPIVLSAPDEGKHIIWIYKTTEAQTGPINIQKITGKNLKAIKVPNAPLIEFIGNSITCGAAADPSEVPCGTGVYHDQHNAYYAYGPRVARALAVNYFMSSVSGIGIYRNWNSDGPAMPAVYEKANLTADGPELWNFKKYSPTIVSIALGTNDFSNGDGKKVRLPFDSAAFVNHYISFVELVKSKYPSAQIALLSSPMIHDKGRTLLQNCLTAVKQNIDAAHTKDKVVALYFFNPMQAHGCSGHPNVEDHAILANELIPFFQKLLQ